MLHSKDPLSTLELLGLGFWPLFPPDWPELFWPELFWLELFWPEFVPDPCR